MEKLHLKVRSILPIYFTSYSRFGFAQGLVIEPHYQRKQTFFRGTPCVIQEWRSRSGVKYFTVRLFHGVTHEFGEPDAISTYLCHVVGSRFCNVSITKFCEFFEDFWVSSQNED